jgi:2-desacetyl-2-hydroxyethyl bacteriochlorophyllide A dehydrogenase
MTVHRAAHYLLEQTFTLAEVPTPDPGPGEVQVAPRFCGICGTDLHIYHGHMDRRVTVPLVAGHEMSALVTAVGSGVEDYAVGDPVTVMPIATCGECRSCRAGNIQVCYQLSFLGIDEPGALQERWNVPREIVVPLPADLPLEDAALIEPLAVAVHDVRRAGLQDGEKVVVIGGGPVGQLIALVARERGFEVLLSEADPERLAFAASLGTDTVAAADLLERVMDWTGGDGADVAFEVSASKPGARALTDVLASRGRGVIVGIYPEPPEVDLFRMFWRELTLIGARTYQRRDFTEAIEIAGSLPLRDLVTAIYPLGDTQKAFERLDAGGAMKVLVDVRA